MSMPNLAGYQAYQKNQYETASPHRLILMLYNGALTNIQRASKALDEEEIADARQFILKAQDIIYELMSCVDEEQGGEIAQNLRNIYFYCANQLIQANIKKDKAILEEVSGYISSLREAWMEIGKEVGLATKA